MNKIGGKVLLLLAIVLSLFTFSVPTLAAEGSTNSIDAYVIEVRNGGDYDGFIQVGAREYMKAFIMKEKSALYNYLKGKNDSIKIDYYYTSNLDKHMVAKDYMKQFIINEENVSKAIEKCLPVSQETLKTFKVFKGFDENKNPILEPLISEDIEDPDQVAADKVISIINALPSLKDVTLEDETAVLLARVSYDKLTKTQKVLVTNLDKLIKAEKKIAELKGDILEVIKVKDVPNYEVVEPLLNTRNCYATLNLSDLKTMAEFKNIDKTTILVLTTKDGKTFELTYDEDTAAFVNWDIKGYTVEQLENATLTIRTVGEDPNLDASIAFDLNEPSYKVDEPIYVKGQVKYKGTPVSGKFVTITVEDLSGLSLFKVDQQTTDGDGKFEAKLMLPDGMKLGKYTINVTSLGKQIVKTFELY